MRDKLIELIIDIENEIVRAYPYTTNTFRIEKTADHLIANGVTVQKWIPVTERLPEDWEDVLVLLRCGDCVVAVRSGPIWRARWTNSRLDYAPTHWMPLPEPPKEVTE